MESVPDFTPVELLEALMDLHNLKPENLIDIFSSESAVSEVLNGMRAISKDEAERLSKRFCVSPDSFLEIKDNEI